MSTNRVEEAKKEQVKVKVEEQTSPAATTDVNQLDQKVMQTKPGLSIENTFHVVSQSVSPIYDSMCSGRANRSS